MNDRTPKYLVMIGVTNNNNKYYKMIPSGTIFTVEYGRIGVGSAQTASYPISQWDKKYNEKIHKGYVDQTHLMNDLIQPVTNNSNEYRVISNPSIQKIVERLQAMANRAISDNYKISSNKVTQAMIDEAQGILTDLLVNKELDDFNNNLIRLFAVIPRKMGKVASFLANGEKDYGEIISREQNLLDVMKGQVIQCAAENADNTVANNKTILEVMGIEISQTSDDDIRIIKNNLGECSNNYFDSWVVTNNKTQERFNAFKNQSTDPLVTKLLWHGSRNENWWSIINSGLLLRPTNAIITGKMFGIGTYFANKAKKSLGYTSLQGSYWAKGSSNSAFMGLYDVIYGTPYNVYSFDSKYNSFNYDKLQQVSPGASCLHAHEGKMLRNDEIIVYKEEQTTIKYLVELKNQY